MEEDTDWPENSGHCSFNDLLRHDGVEDREDRRPAKKLQKVLKGKGIR